ncbi:MAG: DUF177 domain-containing protein, partial [Bacteroidota bacterium]
FQVDDAFFATFPESPVQQAKLDLKIIVDKRHNDLVIDFSFAGVVRTECDRCLAAIDLPIKDEERLMVQFTTDPDKESEDPQLIWLSPDEHQLNLATYAYEFMLLAIPMIRTYNCRLGEGPYPCDEDMLDKIDDQQVDDSADDEMRSSPWDALKEWKQEQKDQNL